MPSKFEDILGGVEDEETSDASADDNDFDDEMDDLYAGMDEKSGSSEELSRPKDAKKKPTGAPSSGTDDASSAAGVKTPAEHERPPEERNWERPEVIEKKGDTEYSNYTIEEAYDAGTLTAGRRYATGRGSIITGLFGGRHVLTQHQVDRMNHDEAYRNAVFEKGPHGPKGQQ